MNTLFDLPKPTAPAPMPLPPTTEAEQELAEYDRLIAVFMNNPAGSQQYDDARAALNRMAEKYGKTSAYAHDFRLLLERATLWPGDSPAGMAYVYRKRHYKKRHGVWVCTETDSVVHSKSLIAILNYNLTIK